MQYLVEPELLLPIFRQILSYLHNIIVLKIETHYYFLDIDQTY